MNNPVSGESSARGQGPHIAVDPAAVAIRRPELWGTLGIWLGWAWQGMVGPGVAWRGMDFGMARQGLEGRAWLGME